MRLYIDAEHFWMAHFHTSEVDVHDDGSKSWHNPDGKPRVCKVTHCTVHSGPCERLKPPSPPLCLVKGQMTGTAICGMFNPEQFVRATGRKIAFTRAVKSLPRNVRAALWTAYNTKIGILASMQPGPSVPARVPTNVGTVPNNNPSPAA